MATLKSKQTSIATVRKHLRTVASLPTSLTFHYPLPLTAFVAVALPEYFSVTLSLLNLLEKSLGCSKPATRLMQAH
jgi:hypothetical protein